VKNLTSLFLWYCFDGDGYEVWTTKPKYSTNLPDGRHFFRNGPNAFDTYDGYCFRVPRKTFEQIYPKSLRPGQCVGIKTSLLLEGQLGDRTPLAAEVVKTPQAKTPQAKSPQAKSPPEPNPLQREGEKTSVPADQVDLRSLGFSPEAR